MCGVIWALLRFYQHIINIDFHCASEKWAEHPHHQPLIASSEQDSFHCASSIFQSERHHIIIVESMGCDEICLFRIRGVHGDLVVSRESVQERQYTVPCQSVHNLIYAWQREAVLWTGIIEVRVIHTNSPFTPLFRNNHHVGQPFGVFNGSDKSIM